MAVDLSTYVKLKDVVEGLRQKKDKARGALDQMLLQLKSEYQCGTIEEAEALLAKWKRQEAKLETEHASLLADFEQKWGALLSANDDTA